MNKFNELRKKRRDKIDNKLFEKAVFQLDDFIRHLLVDSMDVNSDKLKIWLDRWDDIQKENKEIYDYIYKFTDEEIEELESDE